MNIYDVIIEFDLLKEHLKQINKESIHWTIEDFAEEAKRLEEEDMEGIYDSEKFQDALEQMIDKHDAELGITWETIRCYLDDNCLKDK